MVQGIAIYCMTAEEKAQGDNSEAISTIALFWGLIKLNISNCALLLAGHDINFQSGALSKMSTHLSVAMSI